MRSRPTTPLLSDQLLCVLYVSPYQISFFANYMGAPQISCLNLLRLLYGGILRSVYFHTIIMGSTLRSASLCTICEPLSDLFLCLLYGASLRSVSSHTIWVPSQICFFSYYIGAPFGSVSPHMLCGGPFQISFFAYYIPPSPQISFFVYYMAVPLGSVSLHAIMGPPLDKFFRLLKKGPLMSVSSHTI